MNNVELSERENLRYGKENLSGCMKLRHQFVVIKCFTRLDVNRKSRLSMIFCRGWRIIFIFLLFGSKTVAKQKQTRSHMITFNNLYLSFPCVCQ